MCLNCAHDEMEVMFREIPLIFLLHHFQGFLLGLIAALIVYEGGLHFPVMYLVLMRMATTGMGGGKVDTI